MPRPGWRGQLLVGHDVDYRVVRPILKVQVQVNHHALVHPAPRALDMCVAALKLRRDQQEADGIRTAGGWVDTGLVFTTRHGTALEPRNFF